MDEEADELLSPGEVADLYGVVPKTIIRWADTGRIPVALRTPGGHRRFRASEIRALIEASRWRADT